jgi:hypothetical protein
MAMAHPRSIELKTTGEAIRHSLARFFVNVTLALEVKSEAAQVLKEDLKKPFV